MNKDFKNGMGCSEFEALLAEALDDALTAEKRLAFDAHGRSCKVCGPLLAEAWEGMLMVQGLAELEPPKNLVHNILAVTSGKHAAAEAPAKGKDGLAGTAAAKFASANGGAGALALCHVVCHGVLLAQHHADAGRSEGHGRQQH